MVFDLERLCVPHSHQYAFTIAWSNLDSQTELLATNPARVVSELEFTKKTFSFLQSDQEISNQ
jgi:hypothetical protein